MGCSSSLLENIDVTEIITDEKITVFGSEYVNSKSMILFLKSHFWGGVYSGNSFEVVDVNNHGSIMFHVTKSSASNQEINILNRDGDLVFYLNNHSFLMDGSKKIFAKNENELLRISSNFTKTKQRSSLLVNSSGESFICRGTLNMLRLQGSLWYEDEDEYGESICFAKICSPEEAKRKVPHGTLLNESKKSYYVEISPGADAALVLAFILVAELSTHLNKTM